MEIWTKNSPFQFGWPKEQLKERSPAEIQLVCCAFKNIGTCIIFFFCIRMFNSLLMNKSESWSNHLCNIESINFTYSFFGENFSSL
jgi:hypothetical protein